MMHKCLCIVRTKATATHTVYLDIYRAKLAGKLPALSVRFIDDVLCKKVLRHELLAKAAALTNFLRILRLLRPQQALALKLLLEIASVTVLVRLFGPPAFSDGGAWAYAGFQRAPTTGKLLITDRAIVTTAFIRERFAI